MMKARMSIKNVEPRIYEALHASEKQIATFNLNPFLKGLIKIRASQINGCGYCIHMHAKEARKLGETEQRIYALSAWWETPFFTEEEQIALKLTEEVTHIYHHGISDEVYEKALGIFGQHTLAQLIFLIITINSWNRIAITTHMVAEN
jgi:AhpD family alkylhydroperoxidase